MSNKETGAAQTAPTADEIMKALKAPFHPDDIEWRVGATTQDKSKGIALAYVTNRAIMNRLDEVFGPFNWKNEYKEWKQTSQLCGLSVRFDGEWITKWDGADDSDNDAVKGGLSDAMKRAGYQWGIGRYLYNLENEWHPIKAVGKSYKLVNEPQLPTWALPDGFTYAKKPQGKPEGKPEKGTTDAGAGNKSNTSTGNNKPADKTAGPAEVTKKELENIWSKCAGGMLNGFSQWYAKKAGEKWKHSDMKKALEQRLAEKNEKTEKTA